MQILSLKLPVMLEKRLADEARRRQTSKSAVIRDCLTEALLKPGRRSKSSVLELMGDLIGSQRGPKDLSTNKDYMKGFGRERSRAH